MGKFKPGVRVVVIDENHELRKGIIKEVYPEIYTAIVKFDDGNVEKVGFNYLGIDPETKVQEEKPTEPVEKSEITITPDEFRKIGVNTMVALSKDDLVVGLVLSVFMGKLHEALFCDEGEND